MVQCGPSSSGICRDAGPRAFPDLAQRFCVSRTYQFLEHPRGPRRWGKLGEWGAHCHIYPHMPWMQDPNCEPTCFYLSNSEFIRSTDDFSTIHDNSFRKESPRNHQKKYDKWIKWMIPWIIFIPNSQQICIVQQRKLMRPSCMIGPKESSTATRQLPSFSTAEARLISNAATSAPIIWG